MKTRVHGDYHLGQVLYTGNDLVIIDFEGEPLLPLSERKLKKPPLQDIAGMIRSFHYAAIRGFEQFKESRGEAAAGMKKFSSLWFKTVSETFLDSYKEAVLRDKINLVPQSQDEFNTLLSSLIIQKAAYELNYELQNRPDYLSIPLEGLQSILEDSYS